MNANERSAMGKIATCHAAMDGDCRWEFCPQLRDGEPRGSGRHCPLDVRLCIAFDDEEWPDLCGTCVGCCGRAEVSATLPPEAFGNRRERGDRGRGLTAPKPVISLEVRERNQSSLTREPGRCRTRRRA